MKMLIEDADFALVGKPLSKREEFAKAAMMALIIKGDTGWPEKALLIADKMLNALKNEHPTKVDEEVLCQKSK